MNDTIPSDLVNEWTGNFSIHGLTTIVWGTEGILGQTYPNYTPGGNPSALSATAGYIVVSASESSRIEEINIEQGAGFEAVVILLNRGLDVELEVIDDTAITPPNVTTIFTLVGPFGTIPMLMTG